MIRLPESCQIYLHRDPIDFRKAINVLTLIVVEQMSLSPYDNNVAGRAIRPFAIGRKNWMFSKSQAGAKASANLYSLIETAKANNLNVYDYLQCVFKALPNAKSVEDVEALLPWNASM